MLANASYSRVKLSQADCRVHAKRHGYSVVGCREQASTRFIARAPGFVVHQRCGSALDSIIESLGC